MTYSRYSYPYKKYVQFISCFFSFICLASVSLYGQDCDAGFDFTISGCNTVSFSPDDGNPSLTYSWDFGDGSTSNEISPSHTFIAFGNGTESFTVTLTVNGSECDENSSMTTITVDQVPDPTIIDPEGMDFLRCVPGQVTIENGSTTMSTNTNYNISWGNGSSDFESSNFSTAMSGFFIPGQYDVVVTVTGANECVSVDTFSLVVSANSLIGATQVVNAPICLPGNAPIQLSGFGSNTPNTVYTVEANDGSPILTFNHPPPSIVNVFLDSTSCGTTSVINNVTYNDAFQISVTSTTGCPGQGSSAAAGPVRTNTPPIADFEIFPDSIFCEIDEVNFNNTSLSGLFFNNGLDECRDDMGVIWSISPNSGFTITSGSLTDSTGFSAVFNTPDVYSVQLIVENNIFGDPNNYDPFCDADTIVKSICVVPIPDASFNSSNTFGCFPHIVEMDNTSNTLNGCDTALYTWAVNFLEGACDSIGDWEFIDGSFANSIDASIQFNSPGEYEVILITDNRCGIDTAVTNVTIASSPVSVIDTIPNACDDALVFPEILEFTTCNDPSTPTFQWSFPGGVPNSFTGQTPPGISYVNNTGMPQTYTISVTTNNGCGSTVATRSFIIYPSPAIPEISSNSPICDGQTLSFTLDNAEGLDFNWTGPEGWTSMEQNPSIPDASTLYDGDYFLTVTDQISGCTNDTMLEVTVYDLPPVSIAPNPAEVCIGQSVTLNASGAINYQWFPNTNLNTSMGPSVIVTPINLDTLEYVVTGTDDNDCVNRDTTQVIVHPLPMLSIEDPGNLCVNVPAQLEGNPGTVDGGTSFWTGDFISSSGLFDAPASGTYLVTYHYQDDNMCEDSISIQICVLDIPSSNFSLDVNQGCVNLDVQATNMSNTLDNCQAAQYRWRVNFLGAECHSDAGVFEYISNTDSMSLDPAFRFTRSGVYEVTLVVTNDCGDSEYTETVTVGELPQVELDPIADFCDVASFIPTFNAINCELPIDAYLWDFATSNNMPTSSNDANPGTINYGVGTHIIELSVTNLCGTTTDANTFVVLQGPGVDLNLSKDFVCLGDTISVINNSTGDNLSYFWSVEPNDVTISNPTDSMPIFDFTNAGIGDYQIFVSIGNAVCDTIDQAFDVRVSTFPMVSLDTIPDDCEVINIDPVFDYGIPNEFIDSVLWKITNSAGDIVYSSMALDPGVINIMGDDDYRIMVTAYNRCDSSVAMDNFSVLEGPSPLFFIDTNFVCEGGMIMVTDSSGGDGLTYDWTITGPGPGEPNIQTPTSAAPTITFPMGVGIGDYTLSVELSNPVCTDVPWDTLIMVSRPPMVSLDTIPDDCEVITIDPVFDYGIPNEFIDSVLWKVTNSAGELVYTSMDLDPGTINIMGDDDYTIMVTAYNRCDSSVAMDNFSVLEGPSPLFFIDTNFVCEGGMIMVTDSSGGDGLTYDWTITGPGPGEPNIQTPTSAAPTITFPMGVGIGDYTLSVELSNPVCDGVPWDTMVMVSRPPMVSLDTIPDDCEVINIDPVFDYGIPNEFIDSVLWKVTNSAGEIVYTSMDLDPGTINIMGDDDYTIMVTAYNRCDSSVAMDNFSVLEGPSPLFFIDTNFVCEGGMIMVTDSSGGDGLTYDWTITGPGPGEPNIQTPTSAAPTITFPMGVGIGDYTLSVELSNPVCDGVPWDTMVMVSRPPMVSLDTIPDDCEVINIDPVFDYGIPNEFIDSVLWKVTNSAGEIVYTSMDLDPGTINIMGDDDYTIMVTAYNRCDSSVAMDNFSVLEGPSPLFFIDTNFVCEGGMIMVTDSSGGDGLTYDWTITGPGPGEPNIQTPTSAAPTITFPMGVGIGDYTLSVELSNPVCDGVPWDTMVMVSRPPMVSLDTIPDDCEVINIDPVFDYGIPNEFIDSVLWKVTNSAGEIVYTSMDLDPGTINIMGDDDYTIMVTAYNRCDSSVAMDNFSVLEGPSPLFFIDTNFVCEGGMIMVTDSSGGDGLTYDWTITGPGPGEPNIQTPTSAAPTITFPMGVGIGDYTLSVELSNPVCTDVPWDTMVMVSRPPMVSLDTIPDDCEVINIDPVFDYGIPNEFIDSVLWKVTNSAGELVYTSMDLDPGTINIMGDDDYTIMVTAYNRCDSSVAMDNFSILEGPSPLFFIDTNFVCEGGVIMVTDSSGGDGLLYDWTVSCPAGAIFDIQTPTSSDPVITFTEGIGDYTISVELSNPVCDAVPWDTMVMVSRPPMVSLDTIPDDCEVINIDPVFDYGIPNEFIDSVLWKVTNSAGELVYTSMDLDPGTINIMGDDDYTIMVTAYNRCDSSVAMDNFSILEGPSPLFFIDTNFVCEGGVIMVTDSSGGDGLLYDWTVSGPSGAVFDIQTPTSSDPVITFTEGIGDYTISVELSNPVCDGVPWDTLVMVSRPPMVSLDTIPDDCEVINIDPVFDYGIPNEFIDSVLWKVTNSAGELVYTSMDLDPGTINIMGDDDYTIMVTAYNRCDSSAAMDNFSILEGPSPLFFIDTNFVCEGGMIMVTDSSGGDGLLYDWTVSGPAGAIFDIQTPTSSDPVITFTEGIGDYTISVELSNPVCDGVPWDTMVMVSRPPMVSLDTIPDDCEVINIDPVFDYGIPNEFIDSVLWKVTNSAGELVYTSMDLDPGTINIMGDDDYTIMVTAYNRCDSSVAMDNFSVLEGPSPLFFIDTNFVCEGGVIMVTDSSGGDGLLYDWTVSGPSGAIFDIQTPTSSDPVITFTEGIGDYTISVELSNPVCDAVPWDTLVMVSRPPMVSLDTIPDDCEVINIDPVFDYGIPNEFIDSVLWKVTNSAGELVYTSMDLDPGTINIMGDDDYTIMVTAYNRCDSSAAMDNFSILEGPSPLFFIDTNFVCEGGVIMVTDSSGGDGLLYDWTVSGPAGAIFDIQTPTSSDPVITFTEGIGDYTISVELSNPVCDAVPWDTLVMVSRPPMVSLDTIPDDCEVISIDPVFDYGIPNEFIDSVLWKVTNSAGELVYTSMDLDPGTINIMGDDDYTIMVTAYNRCDSSAAMDNFSILEGPSPLFFIDTNFVCEGGVIMVTDSSGGDGLLYDWTVSGPAGAIFDIQTPTSSDPVITFTEGIGDYTISVELSNPVCDAVPWDTLVMVSRPPMVSLDTIPDDCEVINIDPVFDYGIPNEFIDSVLWKVTNSAGELVYTSMDLDPGTINIMGDDDYTIMVTAYNRCDSSAAMDNFSILEGPSPLFFIDTNFVCEGGVIMVTDSSGGDGLLYDWTVSGPSGAIFDIQTPTSSDPVITFTEGIGDYTISVELSNPVCDAVPWDTLVMVSRPPMVSLDTIPDDCEVISIDPVFDYGIPNEFIDSVLWKVTNSAGELVYTSMDLDPGTINIMGDDDYTIMVTAYNRCDSSAAMDNFSILEGPSPLFFIDTNFVCEGGVIMVTDSSGGDGLLYDWTVSGPSGAIFDIQTPTSSDPVITFTEGIGDYTISVELSNPVCDAVPWDTLVMVSRPPMVSLDTIPDDCEVISIDPVFDYGIPNEFIDSVLWKVTNSAGELVYTSMDLDPGTINIMGDDDYTIMVTAYNRCDSSAAMDNFSILEGPSPLFFIDTNFVCEGGVIMVTDSSGGDGLLYDWTVSGPSGAIFDIQTPTSSDPVITFTEGIGDYTISVELSNPVCDAVPWDTLVMVSRPPMVSLDTIPDDCEVISIDPVFDYGIPNEFIDSVLWKVTNSAGELVYTSMDLDPGTINIMGDDDYTIMVTAYNRCDSSAAMDNFSILEGPSPLFFIDTNFVCEGGVIMVTDSSGGDGLLYDWTVSGPAGAIFDIQTPTSSDPVITFTEGIGDYTISVELSNPVCDAVPWDTLVMVSRPPMVSLDTIPDDCEVINIDPVFDYGIPNEFIDSVLWKVTNSAGELVYTSMDLDPGTINIMGDDDYTIMVTAYNRCDSSAAMDNFSILEGPSPLFFIDTNFVCEGGVIMVTDSSGGDGLLYDWTVSGPAGAIFDIQTPTSSDPVITFTEGIGDYTISVELSNPVCDAVPWDTMVMVSRPPMVSLDTVPDDCEVIAIGPVFDYGIPDVFIDSVRWKVTNSLGEMIYTSTDLYPDTIDIVGDDDYTLMVTAYNRCDSSVAMDNFSILEGPSPLFFIDTNFVCEGGMIMVTDSSGGDALLYDWIVSGPPGADIDIQAPTSAEPVVTFIEGIGDYTISVEVSNPVCDGVPWDTVITVNRPPTVSLAEIDSYCDEAVFTPVATYSDTSFIDSVRWILPFITSPVSTSTEFNPGPFTISQTGIYDVSVIVYNRCGSDTATQSFQIYEGPVLDIALDTNSVCRGDSLGVQNSSTGDSLSYIWDAPPGIEIIGDDSPNPIFVLNVPNGDYSITVTISNPACDDLMEVFMVQVIEPPTVMFEDIPDTCELADITPIPIYYEIGFIDSVDWLFPGGNPALSNQFYPESILYQGAGVYTITAEVFNACGMDSFSQSFTIDTIPEIILGSTDTLCVYDSIFQIPPAIPAGGYWTGPGIIDQDLGTFDPSGFPGGQVVTVTYNFEDGECFVSEEKDIYVSDPSYVAVDTTLGFCASDTCSLIQVGEPVSLTNGWYEGPGITDSIGVFCPQLLGGLQDTTVTITYFYREPGTDCIGSDDFTVTVYALPIPGISGIDSLCVDVPETILNTTVDGNTYEWYFSDGGFYTDINPVHTFDSTGLDTIVLIAISIEGCVDSTSAEVFISGPPVAEFEMDTTMGCAILPVTFTNTSIGYQHVNYSWEFGGGDPLMSTLEQPGTVLFDQGTTDTTYFITMVAENHCGIDSYEDSVIVFPSPLTNFMASQYSGCTPLYVAFNNTTLGEPDSFFWDLGNGLTSTDSIPPDQLYTAVGPDNEIYTVTLVAFNECGLDSMSRDILVKPDSLRAFFSVDVNEGCEPLTVEFSNTTSPDSAIVYNWFFDQNDDTSNAQDTSYTFSAQGDTITTYTVSLVVDNGCARDTFSVDIDVFPRPIVSFEAPSAVCAQDSAYFQNTSIDVNGVFWDFGDGNTSSATNPNHFYDAPGTYMVRLTAFSINTGCPNVDSMEVQVRPLPQPSLSVSPLFGCPPLTVDIENTTMDGVFFTWDFGDGNTDVGGNITDHTYTSTGMYDITLIAVDSFGCGNDTIFSSVEVYPVPEAAFDVHQVDQCGVPQEVCMLNFSVGAQGYEWAAGSFSSEENHPCFIFDEAGTYEVGLIAENVFLCSDTINGEFTVYEKPEAFFEIVSDTTCEGAPVFFDNLSSNAEFVTWYYGDGTVDTSWNGQHEYLDTGIYIVNLVAGNNSGCQDTFTMEPGLTVFPTPLAAFDFEKLDNELPTTFSFTDQSSDDVIWHSWDMGDGSFYNSPNVIHRYLSRFSKQVALTVENMYNCIDTTSAQIDLDVLTGLFVPNILEPSNQVDPEKAVFKPKGIGLEIYHIAIYARNGQLVWESTELDEEGVPQGEWDGKLAGVDLPGGVYVWKVHEARFIDGTRWDGMEDQKGKLRTSNFLILVR